MLFIEGVLRVYASEPTMYSPNFFQSEEQFRSFIKSDRFYLLGWAIVNHSPTVVTLDTVKMFSSIEQVDLTLGVNRIVLGRYEESWVVPDPPIPPQFGYKSATELEDMSRIQVRYLSVYDRTAPRYVYLDAAQGDVKVVVEEGSDNLILHQPVHTFEAKQSVFFVNGLCCKPEVSGRIPYGEIVTLNQAAKYCANQTDRNRGLIVMDFGGRCEVAYEDVACDDEGNISFTPQADITECSFLLVVDGRLFTPEEFEVLPNKKIFLSKEKYKAEYICDRLVCENDFVGRTVAANFASTRNVIATPAEKLSDYPNTFLIVLKRKGLKVVRHNNVLSTSGDTVGQVTFHGSSQGILFNRSTKSAVSFLRIEDDNDFYCVSSTTPLKWHELIAYISLETPLEIWAKHNNDMSVHASLHDRNPVQGTGILLRPKYTVLDFVFEG